MSLNTPVKSTAHTIGVIIGWIIILAGSLLSIWLISMYVGLAVQIAKSGFKIGLSI